jgi:hypothetical protein
MALFQLQGSLRLGNGLGFGAANQAGLAEGERPPYLESLVKLFPAEGVGLAALAAGFSDNKLLVSILLTIAISAMVFLLRVFATKPAGGGKTDWVAVIIAVISFYLYALAIHAFGLLGTTSETLSSIMGVIVGIWTAVVPLFPTKS